MEKPKREDFKIRNGVALDASFFNKILDIVFSHEERLSKLELGITDSDEPVDWSKLDSTEQPSQPDDNNEQGEQQ